MLTTLAALQVTPGTTPRLAERVTRDPAGVPTEKRDGRARLAELTERIAVLSAHLQAERERSLLLVLQGIDTSGKDGTIRHVLKVSPSATHVTAFQAPSATERARDYLWRVHAQVPQRGTIGVFNRSHYEDVLAVRVRQLVPEERWRSRYRHIREFERLLVDEGTTVLKCLLHLSSDEQRERLQARIDDPEKRWKFEPVDLEDRAHWADYEAAHEEALAETSTPWAPWWVVPADRKWQRNLVVAELVAATLEAMDPRVPPGDPALEHLIVP